MDDSYTLKRVRFINRTPDLKVRRGTHDDYSSLKLLTSNVKTGIREIIDKSHYKLPRVNPAVFTELELIDKTQKKLLGGISAYLESEKLLAEKSLLRRKQNLASFGARRVQQIEEEEQRLNAIPNIIGYLLEKEHRKDQDKEIQNKDAVMKLKLEHFKNSVIVSRLGKAKMWKPSKHKF